MKTPEEIKAFFADLMKIIEKHDIKYFYAGKADVGYFVLGDEETRINKAHYNHETKEFNVEYKYFFKSRNERKKSGIDLNQPTEFTLKWGNLIDIEEPCTKDD